MKQTLKNLLAGICLAAASVAAVAPALAADISGRVRAVRGNNLVINSGGRNITVDVSKNTRIELDRNNRGHNSHNRNRHDQRISLHQIRAGDYVRIDVDRRGRNYFARDIEVRR